MPLDRDDGSPPTSTTAPPPAPPSEFEQKLTKFLMREVPDSCVVKGVVRRRAFARALVRACHTASQVSSVMGGGMGFLFGGFMNSMEMRPYDHGRPMLALAKEFGKEYVKAGLSMAKNFAIIGGIYQCSECGLEKLRAKTDLYNRCTGTSLARRRACSSLPRKRFIYSIRCGWRDMFPARWRAVSREGFWRARLGDQVCERAARPRMCRVTAASSTLRCAQ